MTEKEYDLQNSNWNKVSLRSLNNEEKDKYEQAYEAAKGGFVVGVFGAGIVGAVNEAWRGVAVPNPWKAAIWRMIRLGSGCGLIAGSFVFGKGVIFFLAKFCFSLWFEDQKKKIVAFIAQICVF